MKSNSNSNPDESTVILGGLAVIGVGVWWIWQKLKGEEARVKSQTHSQNRISGSNIGLVTPNSATFIDGIISIKLCESGEKQIYQLQTINGQIYLLNDVDNENNEMFLTMFLLASTMSDQNVGFIYVRIFYNSTDGNQLNVYKIEII